jgi:hypothetical protein
MKRRHIKKHPVLTLQFDSESHCTAEGKQWQALQAHPEVKQSQRSETITQHQQQQRQQLLFCPAALVSLR